MPHCIIEYAKELEQTIAIPELIERVHAGAVACGLFQEADIKTRAIAYEYFRTGTGTDPFIHVTMKILSGRTQEQKKQATQSVLNQLETLAVVPLSLTVEVRDMVRETYSKLVRG
ncbi:MAG: 5-carboxymethyl-2-hydroxymuconate Delta-isomerase [Motiliproteus sp.]